ncbi:hypothetical protein RCL1_001408 [Eukaryota sp. TZLM3-RCL]
MSTHRIKNSYKIYNDHLELIVSPIGASILALNLKTPTGTVPLMPDATTDSSPLQASSFLMFPYSNRIKNGRFLSDGRVVQLLNAQNHAIHGDVRKRPWFCSRTPNKNDPQFLELSFDSADVFDHFNWIGRVVCNTRFELHGKSLTQTFSFVNYDRMSMLVGGGFHPYFSRHSGPLLSFKASHVFPTEEDVPLPTGPPVSIPSSLDYSEPRQLSEPMDHCYTGIDNLVKLTYPKEGYSLTITSSPNCKHLVVYNPVDKDYFAIEPVLNCNNAHNLGEKGFETGLATLGHNESLHFSFTITVD